MYVVDSNGETNITQFHWAYFNKRNR